MDWKSLKIEASDGRILKPHLIADSQMIGHTAATTKKKAGLRSANLISEARCYTGTEFELSTDIMGGRCCNSKKDDQGITRTGYKDALADSRTSICPSGRRFSMIRNTRAMKDW